MADRSSLVDTYPLCIGGEWVDPPSGRYDRAVAVARRVRTGQIAVNGCIPGDAPFGGFKQSGLGREGGGLSDLHRYMGPKAIGIPA
jgi:aldehyde dehydrogenase (NAD+)